MLLHFNRPCRWTKLTECSVACQIFLTLSFATAIAHVKEIPLQG